MLLPRGAQPQGHRVSGVGGGTYPPVSFWSRLLSYLPCLLVIPLVIPIADYWLFTTRARAGSRSRMVSIIWSIAKGLAIYAATPSLRALFSISGLS